MRRWLALGLLCFAGAELALGDPAPGEAVPAGAATEDRNAQAVQWVYLQEVPHTDQRGAVLHTYDPQRSFFPIAMWGAPLPGEHLGHQVDWKLLQQAGINTVWPWPSDVRSQLKAGADYGMKIVLMSHLSEELLPQVKDDPALFGSVWTDEPIGKLGSPEMEKLFSEFLAYRDMVHHIAPSLPVFVNDAPWIMEPATTWWKKWNTAGDITCHDNYPVLNRQARATSLGAPPNGIPQSVALAVAANEERKPVWLIVGAFEQPGSYGQAFPFRYPTPQQLRSSVYAGIIHGATGIVYFTWDTYVPRDGGVVGMAPDPKHAYVPVPRQANFPRPTPSTPLERIQAKALWETMAQINQELAELTPSILSPTVGSEVPYTVEIVGTAPTSAPLRCLLKPHPDGGYVLLSTNLDDAVLQVTYTMPSSLQSAELLFEDQESLPLSEDAKSVTLRYEPFDSHVVRFRIQANP